MQSIIAGQARSFLAQAR